MPDLVHPEGFNEKILWRMLYDRRPLLQVCSDRIAVRDYVAARAGEKYLAPLLGVFEKPEDIPWADLSPPYVVKATHGCKWNIVVRDRAEVDQEGFCRMLNRWLRTNYYHANSEWSYKHVPRRIMVERFVGVDGNLPDDYKFYCFDGEPAGLNFNDQRFSPYRTTWLDPSWNLLPFDGVSYPCGPLIPPPAGLGEMLDVARALSAEFDFVRVDLYCVDGRVYFGELTTTPAAASYGYPSGGDRWFGQRWRLPEVKSVRTSRSA